MRIAALGTKLPDERTSYIPFSSEFSLLDYDVIIFDTSNIFYEYYASPLEGTYMGYRNLSSNDSVRILEDRERRKNEIVELVNIGKTLIIFCPAPDKCYIDSGRREYSGTGRSRRTTTIVTPVDVNSFLPQKIQSDTTKSSGEEIVFNGPDIFRSFWNKIKDLVYYKAYFNSLVGKPFLFIKGTKKPVGTWFQFEKGNIVVIPHLLEKDDFTKVADYKKAVSTFISAIIDLVNDFKNLTGEYSLPGWTNTYFLPGEKELSVKIHKEGSRLRKILGSIDDQKKHREKIRQYKLLLCGKGIALQKQVISVLNEMGLKAKEGTEGRDDVLIKYNGKIGIAEVKGKSTSAAEKDAAQLEKWVSEYYSNTGVKAKGFLIVNAFCNTPLNKRKEAAFPSQMLPYCKNRKHCLITTVQLLNILLEIKRNPKKRNGIITQLFKTIGIYKHYNNYQDYLETPQSLDYTEAKTEK